MNKIINLFALLFLALITTSCADVQHVHSCLVGEPAGLWNGVWNGMTAPVSFFGSLIWDNIAVYNVNNNGAFYDFGFVFGISGVLRIIAIILKFISNFID